MGYVRSTYFELVYDEYFYQESEFLFSQIDASAEEILKSMVDSDRYFGTVAGIAFGSGRIHRMVLRRRSCFDGGRATDVRFPRAVDERVLR